MTNLAHMLDCLVDGSLVPYRDARNIPRLLDLAAPQARARDPERDQARSKLAKLLRAAVEGARLVADEQGYLEWLNTGAGDRYLEAAHQARRLLGGCMGDEGEEWCQLGRALADAVRWATLGTNPISEHGRKWVASLPRKDQAP